jgi:hypothetical protein
MGNSAFVRIYLKDPRSEASVIWVHLPQRLAREGHILTKAMLVHSLVPEITATKSPVSVQPAHVQAMVRKVVELQFWMALGLMLVLK